MEFNAYFKKNRKEKLTFSLFRMIRFSGHINVHEISLSTKRTCWCTDYELVVQATKNFTVSMKL